LANHPLIKITGEEGNLEVTIDNNKHIQRLRKPLGAFSYNHTRKKIKN
jgi:hypothetical protein